MSFVILVVGFALLVIGADKFVDGAASLAKKLGLPSLIIGLTVVAFGTSSPELAVSVTAGLSGANEIALGNVLGSNTFNLLVVAGLSSVVFPLVVDKTLLNRDWVITMISTALLCVLMFIDGDISRLDAIILLIVFAFVMYLQISHALKEKKQTSEANEIKVQKSWIIALNIILGLAGIIIGGQLSVNGATEIAKMFGLSETLIGLTIVAIGTSLPELVTSIVATKHGENNIAIGNVIGSNLFNILFILGVSCAINPINVLITSYYDIIILLVITVGMFVLAKMNKLNRVWGVILTLMYIGYTTYLIVR